MLPPVPRPPSELLAQLNDPDFGLPEKENLPSDRYHPKLSLDYVGQPYLAAGADALGLQIGGGAALFWSDMLGDHNLVTALQIQSGGGFTDVGAILGYQNNKHRWTWGLETQQVPYSLVQQGIGSDSAGNLTTLEFRYRQTNRELAGLVSYPFSRVLRTDFTAGYVSASFSQKIRIQTFDQFGNRISDQTVKIPTAGSLNLGTFSTDLVYDNTILGATSPIVGQRYHLEVNPMWGTINFVTGIADFRKYIMPVRPFTFAFRVLHYGRYGSGSEDNRLTPLYIGYQDFVRGYDAGTFTSSECGSDSMGNCVFDRLFGSRIAVANFEFRFPILGVLHLGSGYYGFLPLETGVFYDAGVAWTKSSKPSFFTNGPRDLIHSYGAMARLNVLGYFVLEADYVKAVDRPLKNAMWQFGITPGF
jgi:outer membrane protein assembly factor BamA